MIIGLTGGIATGKSTVSGLLKEKGFAIIDADVAARKVVEPGQAALERIIEVFGSEIVTEEGTLNREKLGAIVFHEEAKRKQLNAIVHPAVREWMLSEKEKAVQAGSRTIILDIPLLFESKLEWMAERTLLVYAAPAVQLSRLMKRNNYSEPEAAARINAQMPIEDKKALADDIIDNSGPLNATKQQVEDWITRLNLCV
ncbi:dephospho-CoA kinase [Domibacillus enclensis]|uniref:Dephospho-CoA kinase n=1 Tax=Domibacillus enclensis TaxID=1017273 RepID=A0A1N6Q6B2_9BACI|nr:dephospho-CoA kinase [Domibacillus enclensis]OXS80601.1 dephospho-CoA kinase [Domibacillus enclensis]SIQ12184.1 dephospho-CoA kinase [Domibacillus enclensis]